MIPQLGATPGVGPAATGQPSAEQYASTQGSSAVAPVFGDLLNAMTAGDAVSEDLPDIPLTAVAVNSTAEEQASTAEEQASTADAVSAGIAALLASLAPDATAVRQQQPVSSDSAAPARLELLPGRLAVDTRAADARLLAQEEASSRSSAAFTGLEARLFNAAGAGAAPATALGAASPGLPETLHSLASAVQQSVGSESQGSNALATGLQASGPERQIDVAASRLPQPAPLPQPELRATVSQTLEQVAWMSREGVHQARLQLQPAHLGRVDIWLDVEAGEARLHLGAQQAQVREALEAVLPRLRDALAEQGLSLTDASVSDSGRDAFSGASGRGESAGAATAFAEEVDPDEVAASARYSLQPSGALDIYA